MTQHCHCRLQSAKLVDRDDPMTKTMAAVTPPSGALELRVVGSEEKPSRVSDPYHHRRDLETHSDLQCDTKQRPRPLLLLSMLELSPPRRPTARLLPSSPDAAAHASAAAWRGC